MATWKRTQGHIAFPKVDTWLRGLRSIWLATTRSDGRPHAAPVWFIWDGEYIYFATDPASVKAKNLAHQPYVVVHGGDGDDTIILEGFATPVRDPQTLQQLNELYQAKYIDPYSGMHASVPEDGSGVFRVRVHKILCWEYGAIATRTEWHQG